MTSQAKILIVDDNIDSVKLLTKRLRVEGYDTSEAYDGEQALREVSKYHPDLILLDVMMPKIDGHEVCRRLKTSEDTKLIPIIMLTVKKEVSDKIKGLGTGADDYITKPFDFRELIQRVRYWSSVKIGVEERLRQIRQLEHELIKSERLAAIGQTVSSIAHYGKNIIFGLRGGVYLVNTSFKENEIDSIKFGWEMVERNIGRISDLLLDLLEYSRENRPDYENCHPNKIADEVCELMEANAKEYDVRIIKDFDPSMPEVLIDVKGINRCLRNLISNAIDACFFDSTIEKNWTVKVRTIYEKGGTIIFEVSDNGCGMDEKVKSKLFVSFFSTKEGRGTGLGLLNTQKIVHEHGGSIAVNSKPNKGSTFTIRIPNVNQAPEKSVGIQD